jgi:hypothetical protein
LLFGTPVQPATSRYILHNFQKFVVPALIDFIFGQSSVFILFFKPFYAFIAIMAVFFLARFSEYPTISLALSVFLPALYSSATSFSSELMPTVFSSRNIPPLLSATTTLVLPDLFFLLCTNILQKYSFFACDTHFGDAKSQNTNLQAVEK